MRQIKWVSESVKNTNGEKTEITAQKLKRSARGRHHHRHHTPMHIPTRKHLQPFTVTTIGSAMQAFSAPRVWRAGERGGSGTGDTEVVHEAAAAEERALARWDSRFDFKSVPSDNATSA